MRIGIHTGSAFSKERTGVEEYTYQFIKNTSKLDEAKEHQFILYINPKTADSIPDFPENFKIKKLNSPFLWTKLRLSLELFLHPVDALFIPANFLPLFFPKNTTITIHGLEFEYFPEYYPKNSLYYLKQGTKEALKKAKKIIAVSDNTKKDLEIIYRFSPEKISVVHHGVSNSFSGSEAPIKEKYIFYIGRIEAKKNIEEMVKAFNDVKIAYELPHKLVLAGKDGYAYQEVKNIIDHSPYKDDIILTGYLNQKDKEIYLKNADMFLFPSLYEGFGMPILEAQKNTVPVITSNISSMPEVAGEKGALFVDPKNTESIANAIYRLATDGDLRQNLIEAGKKNAEKYSWEKCAKETLKILSS